DIAFAGHAKGPVNALGSEEFNQGFGSGFHGSDPSLPSGITWGRRMIHGTRAENRYKPASREAFQPGRTPFHAA
ncbi:MAG: hypothetical protein ACKO51_18160, partial [Alphaproteobacteria bacterium]